MRRLLLRLILLQRFPNGKFNIAEQLENLNLESVQSNSERTAATAVSERRTSVCVVTSTALIRFALAFPLRGSSALAWSVLTLNRNGITAWQYDGGTS